MRKIATIFSMLALVFVLSLGTGIFQVGVNAAPNPLMSLGSTYDLYGNKSGSGFFSVSTIQGALFERLVTENIPDDEGTNCGGACGIDIRKQEEGPDSRVFPHGSEVSFDIEVTNTSRFDLSNVIVTDEQVPGCETLIGDLAAGESVSYSCTALAVEEGFTNIACASGIIRGQTVSNCDPSTVELAEIDIRKQQEGDDSREIEPGEDVSFEIVVTNTGEVDLTNVAVTDEQVPGCATTIEALAAGESITYTCTAPVVEGTFTNTACVVGEAEGVTVEDCDDSTVVVPGIYIRKQDEGPDSRVFLRGDEVPFEIVVTNTTDVDMTDVVVTDELVPGCGREIGELASGESVSYSCTAPTVEAGFTNLACVTGRAGEVQREDCDPSTVEVAEINIRKQEEGPDNRVIGAGEDVTFEIVVTNTGEVALTDVHVTDEQVPGCENMIGDLAAEESVTYSCTVPQVEEGFTNTACVVGSAGEVQDLDCDDSTVQVANIDIRKQEEGEDFREIGINLGIPRLVPFEIEVTNTGEVLLSEVMVEDELVPDCEREIGDLAVAESVTYSCSILVIFNLEEEVTQGGITNVATATGLYERGIVEDADPSTVNFFVVPLPEDDFTWYFPFGYRPTFTIEFTMGYEDLKDPYLDYDYNDWVMDIFVELYYTDEDHLDQLIFHFTPQARGGIYNTAFHIDFEDGFLTSRGTATIDVFDQNGTLLPSESYSQAINPGERNRFNIFNSTYVVFPPPGVAINVFEGSPRQYTQRSAELTLVFDEPIRLPKEQLTYEFVGQHGSGLFFDPYLDVLNPGSGVPYQIGKGDMRTLVTPAIAYKWPEEHVFISDAYPMVSGIPPDLDFPDGWWNTFNECVYGDGISCTEIGRYPRFRVDYALWKDDLR